MSRKGRGAKEPRRRRERDREQGAGVQGDSAWRRDERASTGKAAEVIEEFQRRSRAFQTEWNRNLLSLALPGFALFWLGLFIEGPMGMGLPALGFLIFTAGLARGVRLMMRGRQCPACGAVQKPAMHFPWRSCAGCGVRLSHGVKDSR